MPVTRAGASLPDMFDLCGWLAAHGSSCAELIGFVTGVLNVWLVTREHLWSWPVGIVNAAFYIVVFSRRWSLIAFAWARGNAMFA